MVTFEKTSKPNVAVGILKNEQGYFRKGDWEVYKHLNGDQTHQGRHVRIFLGNYMIQRVELYEY